MVNLDRILIEIRFWQSLWNSVLNLGFPDAFFLSSKSLKLFNIQQAPIFVKIKKMLQIKRRQTVFGRVRFYFHKYESRSCWKMKQVFAVNILPFSPPDFDRKKHISDAWNESNVLKTLILLTSPSNEI